jgi:hypothetical protein
MRHNVVKIHPCQQGVLFPLFGEIIWGGKYKVRGIKIKDILPTRRLNLSLKYLNTNKLLALSGINMSM